MKKVDKSSSAGTKDESSTDAQDSQVCQPIAKPNVMHRAGADVCAKDKNGNEIFVGCVISHNNRLYVIKWSDSQKQFVARKEPLHGHKMSWRNMDWIKNLEKYIEIVGTVLFNEVLYKKFESVI